MVRRYFVGDKVMTPRGTGRVRSITTWRDKIVEMSDIEAEEFCAVCKQNVGLNFRDDWVELLVSVGNALVRLQAGKVEIVEGRDEVQEEGLA